jgi:uncharacterized membrane protein
MWSKIKFFGHPIHPMLVAYPIAMYTATLVGFVIFGATNDLFWLKLAIAANVAGVAMAALAALPGFIDWLIGIPKGAQAKRTGLIHGLLNVGALTAFAITLGIYVGDWNATSPPGAAAGIVVAAIGVLFTLAAGWYGWMLVQGHHVGIDLEQEQQKITREREGLRKAG